MASRFFSLKRLAVFFGLFAPALLAVALAEPAAGPTAPTLADRLQAAAEAGDAATVNELAAPYRAPATSPPVYDSRTACLLGIAFQPYAPNRAAQWFDAARDAAKPGPEFARASFWLGETLITLNRQSHARRIAAELERADRSSLAAAYLRARLVIDEWENLPRDAQARRNQMIGEVAPFTSIVLSSEAIRRPTYEPRFLTLAIDLEHLAREVSNVDNGYETLVRLRPRNLNVLRMALALKLFDLVEYRQNLLEAARQRLPADEATRWLSRAERAHRCKLGTPEGIEFQQELAAEALGESDGAPDLQPGKLWLVERAALSLDWRDDPRFPAAVARLLPVVATQGKSTNADRALELAALAARRPDGFPLDPSIELRLCLVAHDYERGPVLAAAEFPAHANDAAWIRAHWKLIERSEPAFVRRAADALLQLEPENPFSQLVSARAHLGDDNDASRYARLFALRPFWGTRSADWVTYRELCEDADARSDFLASGKSVASRVNPFDAALDRWRKALPHDVVVAEQFALRAIRRANAAGGTPETLLIAADAVADALTLGSTAPALVASNAKLQRDAQTIRATNEMRRP